MDLKFRSFAARPGNNLPPPPKDADILPTAWRIEKNGFHGRLANQLVKSIKKNKCPYLSLPSFGNLRVLKTFGSPDNSHFNGFPLVIFPVSDRGSPVYSCLHYHTNGRIDPQRSAARRIRYRRPQVFFRAKGSSLKPRASVYAVLEWPVMGIPRRGIRVLYVFGGFQLLYTLRLIYWR